VKITGLSAGTKYVFFFATQGTLADGSIIYSRRNETLEVMTQTLDSKFAWFKNLFRRVHVQRGGSLV
jgi:hypothetical protein